MTYGISHLFPKFLYRGKLATHDKWKELLVPVIEDNHHSNSHSEDGPACWQCDCFTSFFEPLNIDTKDLVSDILVNVREVIKTCDFTSDKMQVTPQWFNAYGPGQNQEVHDHCPSDLAVIYYVQFDPQCHIGTTFCNSERLFHATRHDYSNFGYGCYKPRFTPDVTEGDVVIFPAQQEHMVQKQPLTDGKLRISFSFNLYLT